MIARENFAWAALILGLSKPIRIGVHHRRQPASAGFPREFLDMHAVDLAHAAGADQRHAERVRHACHSTTGEMT